jgi:hypothetical protein
LLRYDMGDWPEMPQEDPSMRYMVSSEGLRKLLKSHAITKCCRSRWLGTAHALSTDG